MATVKHKKRHSKYRQMNNKWLYIVLSFIGACILFYLLIGNLSGKETKNSESNSSTINKTLYEINVEDQVAKYFK